MKKNLLSLAVLTVSVLSVTTGCNSDSPTTIRISGPAEHRDFITERFNSYVETHEAFAGYKLTYLTIGEDKADSEVKDWTKGPDIYAYASDKVGELYKQGAMAEVPGVYAEDMEDKLTAGAVEIATFANKMVAYPYAGDNGYFLYYNKDVLAEADIASMEALLAKAGELGKKVAYPLETAYYSMGVLFTFGARYNITVNSEGVISDTTANFDGNDGQDAAKAIMKIMGHTAWQNGQTAPDGTTVVACVDGGWNATSYATAMGDAYACAKLPTITVDSTATPGTDRTANLSSFLGYKLYAVNPQRFSNNSDRLALIHELAAYLVSEESQSLRFTELKIAPTNKVVAAKDEVVNTPNIKAISDQAAYAVPQGAVPGGVWDAPAALTTGIKDGSITATNLAAAMTTLNNTVIGAK